MASKQANSMRKQQANPQVNSMRHMSNTANITTFKEAPASTPTDTYMEKQRSRGNGPVIFHYHNGDGSDSRRPSNPARIVAKCAKTGESHELDFNSMDERTIRTLAAQAVSKYVETYVRNHIEDEGATVANLIAKRIGELAKGEIYVRTPGLGGGSRHKEADVTPFVEAYELMLRTLKKPYTSEMGESFRQNLLSKKGLERHRFISNLRQRSPAYAAALLEVQTRMAKAKAKAVKDEINFDDFLA